MHDVGSPRDGSNTEVNAERGRHDHAVGRGQGFSVVQSSHARYYNTRSLLNKDGNKGSVATFHDEPLHTVRRGSHCSCAGARSGRWDRPPPTGRSPRLVQVHDTRGGRCEGAARTPVADYLLQGRVVVTVDVGRGQARGVLGRSVVKMNVDRRRARRQKM